MSNSFTNLNILDCNRQSSEQAKSNNNSNLAMWENKLGTGIKINVGDQIQVNSAFISEEGAGDADTIEFAGRSLGAEKQISFLVKTETEEVSKNLSDSGFAKIEYNSSNASVEMFDNKASIVIEYYKNANGENYFQLPRKFSATDVNITSLGISNLFYTQENSVDLGNASYQGGGLPFHQIPYFSRDPPYTNLYYCQDDYYYFSGKVYDNLNNNIGEPFWKLRNDNSRYTIYVAKESYYVSQLDNAGDDRGITNYAPASYVPNELSDRTYLRYTERIDLQIKRGFNSALNVANDISNQLNATGEVQHIKFPPDSDGATPYFTPTINISTYLEQPTWKTFLASNMLDLRDLDYLEYNSATEPGQPAPNQQAIDYINQTNFIGIKRPDLYDRGIEVAREGLKNASGNFFTSAESPAVLVSHRDTDDSIITNIPWTKENLALLHNLFVEEGNYPELFVNEFNNYGRLRFSGTGTTINNSRFLHLSSRYYHSGSDKFTQLGTDDCNKSGSVLDVSLDNFISLPWWFVYDTSREDTAQGGLSKTELYNGFGLKYTHTDNKDYISFYVGTDNTECPILGEYIEYNNANGSGTSILAGTHIGWDTHFTAFSTCAIALADGWLSENWASEKGQSYWKNGVNPVISSATAITPNACGSQELSPFSNVDRIGRIFLGANNPLLNYNASSNRFTFSNLHTPEFSGNRCDAGGPSDVANFTPVPLNPNADRPVYKINKRNNCWSWTTALIPYTSIDTPATANNHSEGGGSHQENFLLELPNYNFDLWKIFDSQSGIIIKDFGFDENNWANGLWGILGFSYQQFNSLRTSDNDITERLTSRNKQSIPYAFTNALVSASDQIDFNVNGWGAPAYNSMLPVAFVWNGSGSSRTDDHRGKRENLLQENPPPITKEQTSIELVATNLPRRMIRPYYCIRSDIINESHFIGGADSGQSLPVVSIVNKIDGYGDFYFSNESPFVFTATKEKMITSITTSIHYPNQSFANVNADSGVIYKITHQQPAVSNVVEELLQEKVFTKKDLQRL